jgi:metallophosphoesterase (TIGR00282 family)
MKILMIGDVVGRPGRQIIRAYLPSVKAELQADFVVANGENASGGNGLTEKNARQLLSAPVDVLTMGNHVWRQKETRDYIDQYDRIVRPLNYPPGTPGQGYHVYDFKGLRIGVLNMSGQSFMDNLDSPFTAADQVVPKLLEASDLLLVDFHAETTSEKIAMGYYLDGQAAAVVGTHTHVQTADARILPKGTAYITDLGMTGPLNGVLGVKAEIILEQLQTKMPVRYEIERQMPWQLNGVLIDIDETTLKPRSIERVYKVFDEEDHPGL